MEQPAVSSWETDPPEVVAESRPWRRCEKRKSPYFYKLLLRNAEPSCEIGASQRGSKPWNTEAEGAMEWETVRRQPVKIQQAEKT
jgi:hypothetical protein